MRGEMASILAWPTDDQRLFAKELERSRHNHMQLTSQYISHFEVMTRLRFLLYILASAPKLFYLQDPRLLSVKEKLL